MKSRDDQRLAPRTPRQERARLKVELMLEAAMRLLDRGGMEMLTTNAVAETAGVSIGTLYQYFPNKAAILDALADREMAAQADRVFAALQSPVAVTPADRIGELIRAVMAGYGERRRVHRLVMDYSLSRGGRRLAPLVDRVVALLASPDRPADAPPFGAAEAFVLTNAFIGVLRAMILREDLSTAAQAEIERALVDLVAGFVSRTPAPPSSRAGG